MAVSKIKADRMPYRYLTSANDMNNIVTDGHYYCDSVANQPVTNAYGYLIVSSFNSSNNVVLQKYYLHGADGITVVYYRQYNNAHWYPWRKITASAI